MTAPATTRSGVGFRNCRIFALNAAGLPAATSPTTAYEGVLVSGVKALTLNDPEPQLITHRGDDRIFATDTLPQTEPITGELRVGKVNDALDAILTGQLSFTIGEAKFFGFGTDERGDEQQVGILAYRQSLDTAPGSATFGKRIWEARLFPKSYLIPRESNFDENPEERMYTVRPLFVTAHLWGEAFAGGTEGFTQAQGLRAVTEYKPKVVAWLGNNSATVFTFPTTAQAVSTGKVTVWVSGVEQTSGITVATDDITFDTAPADQALIVVLYETT